MPNLRAGGLLRSSNMRTRVIDTMQKALLDAFSKGGRVTNRVTWHRSSYVEMSDEEDLEGGSDMEEELGLGQHTTDGNSNDLSGLGVVVVSPSSVHDDAGAAGVSHHASVHDAGTGPPALEPLAEGGARASLAVSPAVAAARNVGRRHSSASRVHSLLGASTVNSRSSQALRGVMRTRSQVVAGDRPRPQRKRRLSVVFAATDNPAATVGHSHTGRAGAAVVVING